MFEKKWDWEALKLEFIVGELITDQFGNEVRKPYSVERFAKKTGIPFPTLSSRSHKEKWVQERNLLDARLKRRLTENKITQLIGQSVASSSYTLKQLGEVNRIVDAYLKPYLDLADKSNGKRSVKTTIDEDGYSNVEILGDEETPKINPKDLKDIVSVIKEVHSLTKAILGDEELQTAVDEIQTKEKAKTVNKLKSNPKAMDERLEQLIKEREKVKNHLLTENIQETEDE